MTDISVNLPEASKDLAVGVAFPKQSENDSDPLAIPGEDFEVKDEGQGVKQARGDEEATGDENAKEECPTGNQNGDGTSVLVETLDQEGTSLKKEASLVINKVTAVHINTLDSNASTPDLVDHPSPEASISDKCDIRSAGTETISATEIQTETLVVKTVEAEVPNEAEKKTKVETPVLPTQAKETTPDQSPKEPSLDKDLTESKTEIVKTPELSKESEPNVDMLEVSSEISVEEKVRKLFENSLSEKNTELPEKIEAIPEKIAEDTKEVTPEPKLETVTETLDTVTENPDSVTENLEPVPKKLESVPEETVPEKIETESLNSETVPKKPKTVTEKSEAVQEKSQTAEITGTALKKILEKSEEVPDHTAIMLEKLKTIADKFEKSSDQIDSVADKMEILEDLSAFPVKMAIDLEKADTVPEKTKSAKKTDIKETALSKNLQPINGDFPKEEQPTKRRASDDIEESPLKKLCQEVEKTFPHHDSMINDYIQSATKNNIDEIQRHTEQLLAEIQTLRELAQKKEQEWNNILHLKKVKEEILLRLLRRKQVLSFEKSAELNGSSADRSDPFDYLNSTKNLAIDKSDEISGLSIKQPGSSSALRQCVSPINPIQNIQNMTPIMPVTTHFNPMSGLPPPYDKAAAAHMQNMSHNMQSMSNMSNNMSNMSKPVYQPMMMPGPMPGFPRDINAMNGQMPANFGMPMGRQGPTKDVKSIIADYRQRNPDVTPRRGRRMKSILNPNMMNAPRNLAPKDSMNNLNNLNMLFNNLDMNQKAMLERLQQMQAGGLPNSIFKDALVQFATMQQASAGLLPNRPVETVVNRAEHHPKERRRVERVHEEPPHKQPERPPSSSPRLPPPPYPEISLLPVSTAQENPSQSLLHGILTKPAGGAPTLAKLLTSADDGAAPLHMFGQAKNCGEITITPVQPPPEPQPEKAEEVVQLDDEESPAASECEAAASPSPAGAAAGAGGAAGGRLVIDEPPEPDAPLCQGCRRRDAQFVCAGCANQWYCSRDCQVAAWDDHSEMCSG